MALPTIITTHDELVELSQLLGTASWVAVDTEFVWTRTYFPNLGCIQVGINPEQVWIIDTVAITDPTPFAAVMANPTITKIFHDAGQDIAIINRWTGGETYTIFDTQFAAGFTGLGASLSLQAMTKELIGIELEKGATRTDWLQRPLDPVQVAYALDDVRYMPECAQLLQKRAEERGTFTLLQEAHQEMILLDVFSYERGVERNFRKCASRLKRDEIHRAYRLARWLELEARTLNRPREHVIQKEVVNALAASGIETMADLQKSPLLNNRVKDRYGVTLLTLLLGEDHAPKEWVDSLQRAKPDAPALKTKIETYGPYIQEVIKLRDIDPVLVMNKNSMATLVRSVVRDKKSPLLEGWRGSLINDANKTFFSIK